MHNNYIEKRQHNIKRGPWEQKHSDITETCDTNSLSILSQNYPKSTQTKQHVKKVYLVYQVLSNIPLWSYSSCHKLTRIMYPVEATSGKLDWVPSLGWSLHKGEFWSHHIIPHIRELSRDSALAVHLLILQNWFLYCMFPHAKWVFVMPKETRKYSDVCYWSSNLYKLMIH